jgi:hypothetical protein
MPFVKKGTAKLKFFIFQSTETCPNLRVSLFFNMATLPQFSAQTSAPKPVLLQIEDQYNKRIDDDISKLVDCFSDIVKVGEVMSNINHFCARFNRLVE